MIDEDPKACTSRGETPRSCAADERLVLRNVNQPFEPHHPRDLLQRRVFVFYSISLNQSRGSDTGRLGRHFASAPGLIKRYGTEGSRQVRRVRGSEAGRVNAAKGGWCR